MTDPNGSPIPENEQAASAGLPASLAGFEDEASFDIVVNEETLGTVASSWTSDGAFEARSRLSVAGQTVETRINITPDADGRWKEIVAVSPDGTRTSTRDGTSVTRFYRGALREQTTTFETPADALLFDNYAPALIGQALRRYDRAAGGEQRFPLLVGGRPPVTLTVEALESAERTIGGRELALTRFRYGVPGVDLFVWAGDDGRVYLVEVPAQRAVFVRAGYSALRRVAHDPLLSAPRFDVLVERDIAIPMRDGLSLATDIYRPVGVERAPVVLARTPYGKALNELQARFYARRGYVYAAQDCRGCFGSPGEWEPFVNEGDDGYDTIEWLARQSYADGRVGMIGPSYLAVAQWLAAARRPPALVTMIPNVSPTDPFYNVPYEYGAFGLRGLLWWADVVESRAAADVSGAGLHRIHQKRVLKLLNALPVVELDRSVLGAENRYWRSWIEHPTQDAYWEPAAFLDKLEHVNLPVFHQSGWYDGDGIGTKLNYLRMASHGHAHQKLTLGPWGHTDTATRTAGDRDFGESAIIDLQRDYLRWFDHWLKGIDNGIAGEPKVSVFVMGANEWLRGDNYPLEATTFRKLYLSSAGNANTSGGDGRLSFDPPPADAPPDRYRYDPGDPTPASWLYEESEEEERRVWTAEERKRRADTYRRDVAERRSDNLVHQTDPLTEPLTFAGPLSATLYASTSARDTDWFMTVSEIDPDGTIRPVVQGRLRARYRSSMKTTELLEPNQVYRYTIDLWQTGIRLPAGARLRVEVASAAFPLFSRNLNTGGHNETETEYVAALQTIYHDEQRPSHVLLPVIP